MSKYNVVNPDPAALVQSLRSFGYDLTTAVADIIDNSITARANIVSIDAFWDGEGSWLQIADNGTGMTEDELVEAMRPGSKSAVLERTASDLGRFGLGLKSASFSQCKKLIVVSKTASSQAVARYWDLDYVSETGEWRLADLLEGEDYQRAIATLKDYESGTAVIWRNMDRWVEGMSVKDERDHNEFLDALRRLDGHLGMTFHRFIAQPNPVKIYMNGTKIEAWDPFLKDEKFTRILPTETYSVLGSKVVVTPYILPHNSKLAEERHKSAAGPKGWNGQQGFYIYRNRRLLVAGGWLGMGYQKEEHYKLARIQIDLPNTSDHEWAIDVKKSKATIPASLKPDLKRIAGLTRQMASDVYRFRGKIIARSQGSSVSYLWERKLLRGRIVYRINRSHPLLKSLAADMNHKELSVLISLLEETIPIQLIMIDSAQNPDKQQQPLEDFDDEKIRGMAETIKDSLIAGGASLDVAKQIALNMDPFNNDTDSIKIIEEIFT